MKSDGHYDIRTMTLIYTHMNENLIQDIVRRHPKILFEGSIIEMQMTWPGVASS